MTVRDQYSNFVTRVREQVWTHWDSERTRLERACESLERQLVNSSQSLDEQVQSLETEIRELESTQLRLMADARETTGKTLDQCDRILQHFDARQVRETLVAAQWILPEHELAQRSVAELERYLSDRAEQIEPFRLSMNQMLEQASGVIQAQSHSNEQVVEMQEAIKAIESEIAIVRENILRNHQVEPTVLESFARLDEASSERLLAWMKDRRNDAESERSWGTPEQAFPVVPGSEH